MFKNWYFRLNIDFSELLNTETPLSPHSKISWAGITFSQGVDFFPICQFPSTSHFLNTLPTWLITYIPFLFYLGIWDHWWREGNSNSLFWHNNLYVWPKTTFIHIPVTKFHAHELQHFLHTLKLLCA